MQTKVSIRTKRIRKANLSDRSVTPDQCREVFYVGENITEEDIKASFKLGVLNLTLPKKDKEKLPEKKQILIEG